MKQQMDFENDLRYRLHRCGIFQDLQPESLEKMKKGAILLIDRRGADNDEITWYEKGMVLREGKFKRS